jgi:hypothetical protein
MYYIVYKTTNLINEKTYIGIHQTSNLNDGYLGSGIALKRAINKYGKENFERQIIKYCSSYEELINHEKILVNEQWITSGDNYNLKTGGNNYGSLSQDSKNKISESLKRKYAAGEIINYTFFKGKIIPNDIKDKISDSLKERFKNVSHHTIGSIPWNKGLTGLTTWNKGISTGPISDEHKQQISKSLKSKYKKDGHHLKGKPSWRAGKSGLPPTWNKGLKLAQSECPHCGKMVDVGNGKRWHFNNCKLK